MNTLKSLIETLGNVRKADKTPTSRKLREEAGEPFISTDHILIYPCGYAVYTSLNFHPASIRRDPRMYDDKERIIYIFGRTWTDNEGRERPWTELYTPDECASFAAALD